MQKLLDEIFKITDFCFNDEKIINQALSHRSYSMSTSKSYERLEFLGDRVLGLVVAEELLDIHKNVKEGEIAKKLAQIVKTETLAKMCNFSGLSNYIKTGKQKELKVNPKVMADVFESIIGALYIEGGIKVARNFILKYVKEFIDLNELDVLDNKSYLQEWSQKKFKNLPLYELTDRKGPDHSPLFEITVSVENRGNARGYGKNKQEAMQNAAGRFIRKYHIDK